VGHDRMVPSLPLDRLEASYFAMFFRVGRDEDHIAHLGHN
jgi:hypothetical protein